VGQRSWLGGSMMVVKRLFSWSKFAVFTDGMQGWVSCEQCSFFRREYTGR